jgi:hypothetical protein
MVHAKVSGRSVYQHSIVGRHWWKFNESVSTGILNRNLFIIFGVLLLILDFFRLSKTLRNLKNDR